MQVVIANHHVALLGQRRKSGVIRLETRAENDGSFFVGEGRQLRLQFDVQVESAI